MRRVTALLAAVALVAAAACGDDGDSEGAGGPNRDRLTVVLDWTPNTNHAGLYLAQARGWYREAGLEVEIRQPGDAGALQLLGSGRADIALTVHEELVPARAEGVPAVALAAVIQHNTSSLLALADEGVRRPADLEGKSYGGFGGPLERELVSRLVRCDGGDPSTVEFTDVGNVDYRVGLERDFYDFVWIFDGWDKIRLADVEQADVTTLPFIEHTDCIPDWYTPMIATTEAKVDQEPEVVERFMAATAQGYRAAMAEPDAAADALLEAAPELDERLVRRSARYLATRFAEDPGRWGRQETAVWERFVEFLVDAGLIEEPIEVGPAFTNRFLPGEGGAGP
jgi:ABC-type nitrate/sulfonate/bicarbonate transport system substrate-binding protein